MKTHLVTQPTDDEGPSETMGGVLSSLLTSRNPFFDKVWLVSAFANQQAVRYLSPHISEAKSHGADIRIVVGIDHHSTSIEALRGIKALEVDARIVHNARPGHTFHPKIYLFEAGGIAAELFIGSNNLTEGGLYTNYEASTQISFVFPEDTAEYDAIKKSLEKYLNPSGRIVQPIDDEIIEALAKRRDILPEEQMRSIRKQAVSRKKGQAALPSSPFGSERTAKPPKLPRPSKPKKLKTTRARTSRSESAMRGNLVWQKTRLPPSDVQKQAGNVTGGLRLTQARWEVGGKAIDQTTYFRQDIFGHLPWSTGAHKPKRRETVKVPFVVYILGKSYGRRELVISHKPSGEAGQGNYTTMLHWGELSDEVRGLNLTGKTFRLYAPKNEGELYVIEII